MKKYYVTTVMFTIDKAPDDKTIIQRAIDNCKANCDISYITISDIHGNLIAEVNEDSEVRNV